MDGRDDMRDRGVCGEREAAPGKGFAFCGESCTIVMHERTGVERVCG